MIGQEQGISIVQKYDIRSLFPMLLKCHQHLHPLVESKIAKQNIDVAINLDTFEMSITYIMNH